MDVRAWHSVCSSVATPTGRSRPERSDAVSDRDPGGEGRQGEPASPTSRLLFVVARGQAELRSAIERVFRGRSGVEVVEDRRGDGCLLPRPEREPVLDR
jgi:hypothetical protein